MKTLVDLLERVGWTALQAFVGALTAVNVADIQNGGWTLVLTTAGVAALVAALKTLGVKGSQASNVMDALEQLPTVERWTRTTPAGRTTESVVRRAARELTSR